MRVLHIDDDEATRFLVRSYMALNQVQCTSVEDEPTFLNASGEYNLIICDGQIPKWPGHIEQVLAAYPYIETVIYTGCDRSELHLFKKYGCKIFCKGCGMKSLGDYVKNYQL